MYCPFCGFELPDNAQFCPSCGKSQTENASTLMANNKSISAQVERERNIAAFTQDEKRHFEKEIKSIKIVKGIGKVIFILLALPIFLISFGTGFWGVVVVSSIIALVYWFFHHIFHKNDCPECKSFGTMEDTRADFQGSLFTLKGSTSDTHFNHTRHHQVCYKCGYSRIVDRLH